jgi:dipeptidase E
MKLILTGGGDSKHFEAIDKLFMGLMGEHSRLLFIPLAGEPNHWQTGLERIQETFRTIEFDYVEMCEDLSGLSSEHLALFDAIYIDGGNTFRLMSEIRETHTYELFYQFLHHGGIINGDSAGAIVLGSHLETAHFGRVPDENRSEVISYQGLNFLGNYAIHCHYEEEENDEIQDFVLEYGFPVIALHENSSVYFDDGYLKVVGESKVVLFQGDHILQVLPGMEIKL